MLRTQQLSTVPDATPAAARAPGAVAGVERGGFVTPWALFGVVWCVTMVVAWGQWIASPTSFTPAPILPGDVYPQSRLIALRVLEVISTAVACGFLWQAVIRPWRRDRRLGLDAALLLAGVFGWGADAFLNVHDFLFAFNAYSINRGVWTQFMPFYTGGPAHYAESLLWGAPMYVYFCLGGALVGCRVIAQVRARFTGISNAAAYGVALVVLMVGDFVIENAIIRSTQAYMFPKTYEPLTLFAGSIYQFPIYESVAVGIIGVGFTVLRQTALEDPRRLSIVERGCERLPPALQLPARWFAVVGACVAILLLSYHLPVNWLGLIAAHAVELPSYMRPG